MHVLNVNVTVMNQFMVITQFLTPHTKSFICSSICTAPWSHIQAIVHKHVRPALMTSLHLKKNILDHPDYVEVQFNYLSLIKDFI